MLVLSRKSGEEICIGPHIKVEVLSIKGGRVSLGLSAPPEVSIKRAELRPQTGKTSTERPTGNFLENAEPAKALDRRNRRRRP
jgi:carbon storage regulator